MTPDEPAKDEQYTALFAAGEEALAGRKPPEGSRPPASIGTATYSFVKDII